MEINNLIKICLNLVKIVEKSFSNMDGENKKKEFLTLLKNTIGSDIYEKNELFIETILETIIFISKTHVLSGVNVSSFKCF
jgi:hypothetical protein